MDLALGIPTCQTSRSLHNTILLSYKSRSHSYTKPLIYSKTAIKKAAANFLQKVPEYPVNLSLPFPLHKESVMERDD